MRTLLAAAMIVAAASGARAAGSSEGRDAVVAANAATRPSSPSFTTANDEFRSISQFVSAELHPALAVANKDGSSIGTSGSRRHRFLEDTTSTYFADFDDICEEMRLIFNQQCSCGAVAEERSDMVTCQSGSSGGLEASAHFDSDSFALETIEVCKQRACTVIHYQNRTGTRCEATYGDSGGRTCGSCRVCTAAESGGGSAMMGLEIDCTNVNPQLSVNCTAVSDILDLSGAVGTAASTGLWAAAIAFAVWSVAILA